MLTESSWEQTLRSAWESVRDRVELRHDLEFSHEHTLQFHFAWEVGRLLAYSQSFQVRFEVYCGEDTHEESIRVDLILWTDPTFKIVVEMKAPIRSESGMNSAMTYGRMAFYRDIDRLRHLVERDRDGIQRGMFLAVVNERGYVVRGRQTVNEPYATYDGTRLQSSVIVPACPGSNGCEYPLTMPANAIVWRWPSESRDGRIVPSRGMRHFWLEPIAVYARANRGVTPTGGA